MIVFEILEVVLRHYAKAICCALCLVHILARTVQILQRYGEVRCYVAKDIAKYVLTTTILILREIAVALI